MGFLVAVWRAFLADFDRYLGNLTEMHQIMPSFCMKQHGTFFYLFCGKPNTEIFARTHYQRKEIHPSLAFPPTLTFNFYASFAFLLSTASHLKFACVEILCLPAINNFTDAHNIFAPSSNLVSKFSLFRGKCAPLQLLH